MKIIIASPNFEDHTQLKALLDTHSLVFVTTGIDAQVQLSKDEFSYIVIDSKIERHSFPFILKFCKSNCPSMKILLYFQSEDLLKELDMTKDEVRNLGITAAVYGPDHRGKITKCIQSNNGFASWQQKSDKVETEHGEHKLNDKLFTKLEVRSFFPGNTAIFDIYLRLGKDKYLKFVNRGELADPKRIKSYIEDHDVEFFYFKTEERMSYINYINHLIEKKKSKGNTTRKAVLLSGATEKFLEEIYTKGLDQDILDEGVKICDNAYKLLTSSSHTRDLLLQIPEEVMSHNFLTLILSNSICDNLDWTGTTSAKNISTACLIHDIGLVKFKWFRDNPRFNRTELTKKQEEEYVTHPSVGYEMLEKNPLIPEAVRQIILQHHEHNNGTGFPHGLSTQKIYPLAKIVGLADFFSHLIIDNHITPIDALRKFIPDRESTDKYSPENIKALIKGFIKNV